MSIRLLVVGHTYAMSYAQHKFVAMKRIRHSLQLRFVVPLSWKHLDHLYQGDRLPDISPAELAYLPFYLASSHMTYVVHPGKLYKELKTFNPTHILIEEDPHSAIGIEMATVIRVCCPDAHVSFFIWDNINRRHRGLRRHVKSAATHWALGRADLVICGNERARELLADKGYAGASCVLPQLAVEPALYKPCNAQVETPTILFVGRLVPEKGLFILFDALLSLLDLRWQLLVVGDGPLRGELENRAEFKLCGRVRFLGAVRQDAVPPILSAAHILVLPSISTPTWQEQFGYVLVQAMMSSLAVIATRSGAIPEVVGDAAVLVDEDDVASLGNAIRAIVVDPVKRMTLGKLAYERACERYSPSVVGHAYLDALGA